MTSLAAALPVELVRVAAKRARWRMYEANSMSRDRVIYEHGNAMMTAAIDAAVKAMGEGDLVGMLRAYEQLKAFDDA